MFCVSRLRAGNVAKFLCVIVETGGKTVWGRVWAVDFRHLWKLALVKLVVRAFLHRVPDLN